MVTPGGGQFRVETAVANVTVLGTEFSVKLDSRTRGEGKRSGRVRNTLTVAVTEGSVKVDSAGKSYVLTAGERRTFPERAKREEGDD
jgi:ferric-dicitrate binding protein FerR (iron transport regulator)